MKRLTNCFQQNTMNRMTSHLPTALHHHSKSFYKSSSSPLATKSSSLLSSSLVSAPSVTSKVFITCSANKTSPNDSSSNVSSSEETKNSISTLKNFLDSSIESVPRLITPPPSSFQTSVLCTQVTNLRDASLNTDSKKPSDESNEEKYDRNNDKNDDNKKNDNSEDIEKVSDNEGLNVKLYIKCSAIEKKGIKNDLKECSVERNKKKKRKRKHESGIVSVKRKKAVKMNYMKVKRKNKKDEESKEEFHNSTLNPCSRETSIRNANLKFEKSEDKNDKLETSVDTEINDYCDREVTDDIKEGINVQDQINTKNINGFTNDNIINEKALSDSLMEGTNDECEKKLNEVDDAENQDHIINNEANKTCDSEGEESKENILISKYYINLILLCVSYY